MMLKRNVGDSFRGARPAVLREAMSGKNLRETKGQRRRIKLVDALKHPRPHLRCDSALTEGVRERFG